MSKELINLTDASLPRSKLKACFFDIDGTLVSSTGTPSKTVIDTIAQLQDLGVITSIVTGRPYFGAQKVISACKICHLSVFYSGSLIIQPGVATPLFEASIPKSDVSNLVELFRSENLHIELYTRNDWFVLKDSSYSDIHIHYLSVPPKISSFEPIIEKMEILKIGLIVNRGDEEKRLRNTLDKLSSYSTNTAYGASHPDIVFGNVTSKQSSRENAFKTLIKYLSIKPKETVSFGDGESDIPFLSLSGVGVSMGNANQSVKDAARFVTKNVEEDGVPYALRRIFRLN